MALTPGTRLGSYEILAPLGVGGMGEVLRARDTKLGRLVAIKILRGELAMEPNRLKRFEQEARFASSLNHTGEFENVRNESRFQKLVHRLEFPRLEQSAEVATAPCEDTRRGCL